MSPHPVLAAEDLGDLILGWELITSLPVIVAIAFLAGRLLRVRRSWTTAVASGVVGWLAGAALALVIARAEGGASSSATSGCSAARCSYCACWSPSCTTA